MKKTELRKHYKTKRQQLTTNEVNQLSERIVHRFLSYTAGFDINSVLCFIPITKFNEVNVWPLIELYAKKHIPIYLPKVNGEELSLHPYLGREYLQESSWGILEPVNPAVEVGHIDLCITPLLYADTFGNRVGYGKGFYDRVFAKIDIDHKIGVSFFEPKEIIEDHSPVDVPLDVLVTPVAVHTFSGCG